MAFTLKTVALPTDADARTLMDLITLKFRLKGWKAKRSYQSAMTECVYTPDGNDRGERLCVTWHWPTQKSRAYGVTEARLLGVYYTDAKGKYTELARSDFRDVTNKSHQDACKAATLAIEKMF